MKGDSMDAVEEILKNLNTWIVCLLTGAVLWGIQQVVPASLVKKTWWKKILKVAPLLVGALLAIVPDLRPVPESLVHSAAVGFIFGSIAQSVYDLLREYGPSKLKALLGARAKRTAAANGEE